MAEENKKIAALVDIFEKRKADAIKSGRFDVVKALDLLIPSLKFDDPKDEELFLRNNPKMDALATKYLKGSGLDKDYESLKSKKTAYVKRDPKTAKRTIDAEGLISLVPAESAPDLFEVDSPNHWTKWTPANLNDYAAKAGMSRGDFMKRVGELATAYERDKIVNDGSVGALAVKLLLPRARKDVLEGNSPTAGHLGVDFAENMLQAIPVGKAVGLIPKIGAKYAGYTVPFVKPAFEASLVPAITEGMDATINDEEFSVGDVVRGASVNAMTPYKAMRAGGTFIRMLGEKAGKKMPANALSLLPERLQGFGDAALESGSSLLTNKAGKDKYADAFSSTLGAIPGFANAYEFMNQNKKKEEEKKELEEKQRLERERQRQLHENFKNFKD